jgi:hypothetical protein
MASNVKLRIGRVYRSVEEWWKRALTPVNRTPIFVLGNQKSGTTAIAALLAKYAGLSSTLDLTTHYSSLIVDIHHGEASVESLISQNTLEFSRDVIKDPNLTFLYSNLRKSFPDAKFVLIVRDPRDSIRSILDRLGLPGDRTSLSTPKYKKALSEYDGMYDAWKIVLDGSWMGLDADHYVGMLAARWQRAATIYLEHAEDIELIRYEDFCADKVGEIKDLAGRLGLSQKNRIEHEVDLSSSLGEAIEALIGKNFLVRRILPVLNLAV